MLSFKILKTWYVENKRSLPWRGVVDPYVVWLSEIILQQTRVNQGLEYFNKILKKYPTIHKLAAANENELLVLWQGLGYYSRALNLHKTAKLVSLEMKGEFPKNFKGLLKLPGVGEYTAAAIASFCYKEVVPVLDGNVYRVISRIYGINEPINTPTSRKIFIEKLNNVISHSEPDTFNQAIMEFGALQCTPKKPQCTSCPFQQECVAYNTNTIEQLPVKKKANAKKVEFRYYFYLHNNNKVAITKRDNNGIWKNLYEFPVLVSDKALMKSEINNRIFKEHPNSENSNLVINNPISKTKHLLSHIYMNIEFFESKVNTHFEDPSLIWVKLEDLNQYAFHQVIRNFINEIVITTND